MSGAGRSLIGAAGLLALLGGCGQTGPLYMPDDEAAAQKYDRNDAYDDQRPAEAIDPNVDAAASPNEQDDED